MDYKNHMKAHYRTHTKYWDGLARIVGCVACRVNGHFNDHVSIHHIDGRTKEDTNWKILPLCAFHHQHGTEDDPSIHPWKARFEYKYGTQQELQELCNKILIERMKAQ